MGDGKFSTVIRDVVAARNAHDKRDCSYGGTAIEVHFNPDDATRLGIEEGEDIAGLRAVHDHKQRKAHIRVYCDAELHGQGEPVRAQSAMSITTPTTMPEKVGAR